MVFKFFRSTFIGEELDVSNVLVSEFRGDGGEYDIDV
jgi:hypothetical protein